MVQIAASSHCSENRRASSNSSINSSINPLIPQLNRVNYVFTLNSAVACGLQIHEV